MSDIVRRLRDQEGIVQIDSDRDGRFARVDLDRMFSLLDAATRAADRFEALQAVAETAEPFARFAEAWRKKPLAGIDDRIYGIHGGTEFEAFIRLSDCKNVCEALAKLAALDGEGQP